MSQIGRYVLITDMVTFSLTLTPHLCLPQRLHPWFMSPEALCVVTPKPYYHITIKTYFMSNPIRELYEANQVSISLTANSVLSCSAHVMTRVVGGGWGWDKGPGQVVGQ